MHVSIPTRFHHLRCFVELNLEPYYHMIQQLWCISHNAIKELSSGFKICIAIIHLVSIHMIYLLPTNFHYFALNIACMFLCFSLHDKKNSRNFWIISKIYSIILHLVRNHQIAANLGNSKSCLDHTWTTLFSNQMNINISHKFMHIHTNCMNSHLLHTKLCRINPKKLFYKFTFFYV